MVVSDKKLGCLEGIKRTNMDKCGYIEGSVNESLKSGMKEVCVDKDGKVIFWIVNDYDVTVGPEDVATYSIAGINVKTREYSRNVNDVRIYFYQYTVNYDITFTNGTTGILKVTSITVQQPESNYNAINATAFATQICPNNYAAEVAGWLNPNGERDDKYNAIFCPEGYTPHIIGFRKISSHFPCHKLPKALGLIDMPLDMKVRFGNMDVPFIRV